MHLILFILFITGALKYNEYCQHETHLMVPIWWRYAEIITKVLDARNNGQFNYHVDHIRELMTALMAVTLFSPLSWGNNEKKRSIYDPKFKQKYGWDNSIPFGPVNSDLKVKRQKVMKKLAKQNLLEMFNYLIDRFQINIRPLLCFIHPVSSKQCSNALSNKRRSERLVKKAQFLKPPKINIVNPCQVKHALLDHTYCAGSPLYFLDPISSYRKKHSVTRAHNKRRLSRLSKKPYLFKSEKMKIVRAYKANLAHIDHAYSKPLDVTDHTFKLHSKSLVKSCFVKLVFRKKLYLLSKLSSKLGLSKRKQMAPSRCIPVYA